MTTGTLTIGNNSQVLIYGSTAASGAGGTNSLFTNCDTTTVGIATGLTTGVLNIGGGATQSGAININAVNINLGGLTTILSSNCNSLKLGATTATGNFDYNGATTTGANGLFNNATTSNITIANGLTTGTLTIGRFDVSTGTTTYNGTRTGITNLLTNITTGTINIATALTNGPLTIGAVSTNTSGTTNIYGSTTSGGNYLFPNTTTGSISIGTNCTGAFNIGKVGGDLYMYSTLNLSAPITQKQATAPTASYQYGYTLTGQLSPGTLAASSGTYSQALFGPTSGSPIPLQPNSATNFGLWYIQISIAMTPYANTYGAMSLGPSSAFNANNAVSINYNMRDVGTTYAQVSGMFPIYNSTTYVYFYVKNLYTDLMVFPANSVNYTMTRVA